MPSRLSLVSAILVGASLTLVPLPSFAGPGPNAALAPAPVEGPAKPPPATPTPSEDPQPPTDTSDTTTTPPKPVVLPPPSIDPTIAPEPEPGIEFAVPPPEEPGPPTDVEPGYIAEFPDPGTAPSDGRNILVLSGTTIALTAIGFGAGLTVGLQRGIDLGWLLPSTIVPTVGLLAFSAGGMYLGIKRAAAYRRWEVGYRVIGTPQGGGLRIGASFTLLGALGFIPSGIFSLRSGQVELGATMIAIGSVAAVATPIMFTLAGRFQANYQRTGGWRRRPVPPLPPGAKGARLEWIPMVMPLPGGVGVGAAGRF